MTAKSLSARAGEINPRNGIRLRNVESLAAELIRDRSRCGSGMFIPAQQSPTPSGALERDVHRHRREVQNQRNIRQQVPSPSNVR